MRGYGLEKNLCILRAFLEKKEKCAIAVLIILFCFFFQQIFPFKGFLKELFFKEIFFVYFLSLII